MKKIIFTLLSVLILSNILISQDKVFNAKKKRISTKKPRIEYKSIINEESKASTSIISKTASKSIDFLKNKSLINVINTADINLTLYQGDGAVNNYDESVVEPGGTFNANMSVVNWGTLNSGEFKVYIVLSTDNIYNSSSDYKVGEMTVNSISGGYYRNLTISCTVPYSVPSGQYYVMMIIDPLNLINESKEDDNIWYYNDKITVSSDIYAPVITHTPPAGATYNTALPIVASAYDEESGVYDFYVQYRISGTEWNNSLIADFVGGTATIPANYITEQGIDYRIYAEDYEDNYDYWTSESVGWAMFQSVPVNLTADKIATSQKYGGTDYTAYRLFSLPYNFGSSIKASDFFKSAGDYNKQWRLRLLFKSNEFIDGKDSPLEMGEAGFLITRNDFKVTAPGPATTNKMSYFDAFGIILKSGWSLIGNPFPFRVPIKRMYIINQTDYWNSKNPEAYEYKGSSGWVKADYLYPWEGIAVYNPGSDTKLQIWWDIPSTTINKISNDGKNWRAQVLVKSGNITDQENYFGMQEDENIAGGSLNCHEPPAFEESVSAYFNGIDNKGEKVKFGEEYKSSNLNGSSWDFIVHSEANKNVTLTFKDLKNIPAQFSKYLYDIDRNISYDLSQNNEINISSGSGIRNFKIFVGNESYLKQNLANTKTLPEKMVLLQNFPNPFNPVTTIMFSIPAESNVKLNIYDSYGRLVSKVLDEKKSSGYHELSFNASNLSSGVYYYRLDVQGEKSYSEIKKMVLMK